MLIVWELRWVGWRGYGKDRLYVAGEDGAKLGYRDLVTGQDHLDAPQRRSDAPSRRVYALVGDRSDLWSFRL
jgi:hypothetical protein